MSTNHRPSHPPSAVGVTSIVNRPSSLAISSRPSRIVQSRSQPAPPKAKQLIYGPDAGLTTGASADLEQATHVARQMVCRHGMDDQFGLLATPELLKYEAALSSLMYVQVNQAASKILQAEMERTRQLLEQNRQQLEAVTVALAANERLTADDLQKLLPEIQRRPSGDVVVRSQIR